MKTFFTLLLITCVCEQNIAQHIDVLNYRFEIGLNDKNDSIYGKASITLTNQSNTNSVSFDLKNISNKKGMTVYAPVSSNGFNLQHKHQNNRLQIQLPQKTKVGDTVTVIIKYKGIPADGLIISKNKFGKKTFFSDNWPNRAHNWLPCVDHPGDKASVEFIVTAPSQYQVISNGIQIEETNLAGNKKLTHYKEVIPLPTKIMVIGVAEFAVNHAGVVNDCIPVSSWVFPENKTEGFEDYKIATDVLSFYSNYIAPYPYKKLANVQSKTIFGGMENASAIFYFENSVNGKRDQEALIAHEIVHQWFGNMATEKSFAHFWLSEGFATYLTHVFLESKYGTDSLEKRMQKDRAEIIGFVKSSRRPVVDSTSDFMSLLNENSYQKGSWILHMLRRQLGDSIFKSGIRQYYRQFTGKNADSEDFQKIFEQVSGKNLRTFFRQWLHTPENPTIQIDWNYQRGQQQIQINLQQLQKTVFEFPLQIAFMDHSGKQTIFDVEVKKQQQSFTISFASKPAQILLDPNTSMLFEAKIAEKN